MEDGGGGKKKKGREREREEAVHHRPKPIFLARSSGGWGDRNCAPGPPPSHLRLEIS
jgi:hypothetical protein